MTKSAKEMALEDIKVFMKVIKKGGCGEAAFIDYESKAQDAVETLAALQDHKEVDVEALEDDLEVLIGDTHDIDVCDRDYARNVIEFMKANGLLRTAPEWQPIETAPKDGTSVLIGKKTDIYGFIQGASYWIEDELLGGGWLSIGLNHINGQRIDLGLCAPTHWMPLPPAPKDGGGV